MAKNVELTSCQNSALDLLRGDGNVFLTGGAGSGKSFLLKHFMKAQAQPSDTFPILASTGAAAVLIGGRTFHSFFGLGILEGGVEATIEKASRNRQVVRRLKKITGFVVDEVSMLSGPTLRAAEVIARRVRDSEQPWGGLKVVAVGDFAQLPPIDRTRTGKAWAFLDPVWDWSAFSWASLTTQTRCLDPEYIRILNYVRDGEVRPEVTEFLNDRQSANDGDFDGTRLFPLREQTDRFNHQRLEELQGRLRIFESVYTGESRAVEQLKKQAPIGDAVQLKEGALIMIRVNDPLGRYVNGSTGHVEIMEPTKLRIRLLSGRAVDIEKSSFSLMDADGTVVASVTNFPVSLAYATTIHKAQGATLDRLLVDLSRLWEPGQAYVALSRVTRGLDLFVEKWSPSSIKADPIVRDFYRSARSRPEDSDLYF